MNDEDAAIIAAVERSETVVANTHRHAEAIAWAKARGLYTYVGRRGPWGNPWSIRPGHDRDAVCDRHLAWLREAPRGRARLARVAELRGRLLVCFSAPLRCHADDLARLAAA